MPETFIDLITKKRDHGELAAAEIERLVTAIAKGAMPDHQIGALLMAMYLNGLTTAETVALTHAMVESGETVDLSAIRGFKADKHSTGGVGDKVTLVLGPLVAAAGIRFPKLSGRGLGHTGGTLDKLESIPGMRVNLSAAELIAQVQRIGLAVSGQTRDLVPADGVMYALRDQSGTVESKPLIASSIMSKKLAMGADGVLLDVKCGGGAFMTTLADATELARLMVAIGVASGKQTRALVTPMDVPLGRAVGNALEVQEAIETLDDRGPVDLIHEVVAISVEILMMAMKSPRLEAATPRVENREQAREHLWELISNGTAKEKLRAMIDAQGGDPDVVDDPGRLPQPASIETVTAETSGFVRAIDAHAIGEIAMDLGAGRRQKADPVSASAGVRLLNKPADATAVTAGESPLVELHIPEDWDERVPLETIRARVQRAFTIGSEPAKPSPTILATITEADV